MLCQRCRHMLARAASAAPARALSSASAAPAPARNCIALLPPATAGRAARAFTSSSSSRQAAEVAPSTSITPATQTETQLNVAAAPPPPPTKTRLHGPSSVPAGTPLKGINYFANKPDPVALADEEYPDWLWNLVLDHKAATTTAGGVNVAEMTKKQRKRHMKKMAALAAEQPRVVPLHEQSVDITPATAPLATEAETLAAAQDSLQQRTEIRKSARAARRKAIREANFLKGM